MQVSYSSIEINRKGCEKKYEMRKCTKTFSHEFITYRFLSFSIQFNTLFANSCLLLNNIFNLLCKLD